jgi:tRNA modification GTPase
MKKFTPFDTIAAVSTPPGEGGIGIVRLSGDRAFKIAGSVFSPHRNNRPAKNKTFFMRLGYIMDNGKIIDEVLVSYMSAPHTYTREDVVEINCHGGAIAVNEVLRLVLRTGARLAEPGEFTKRAFINGRIDLTQAEAVLDIVQSRTSRALDTAVCQLRGNLSGRIKTLIEKLKQRLVLLEANIDFAEEEDVSPIESRDFHEHIENVKEELVELTATYDTGKIIREGVLTVLAGKPNVGKSSILNCFVQFDRAIVTPIPGTTRDIIEEELNINGIPFILADTAGIADSDNIIEQEGVKRSLSYMEQAQLVLLVLDGSSPFDDRDVAIIRKALPFTSIPIVNKIDLPMKMDVKTLMRETEMTEEPLYLSAKTGAGLAELERRMSELVAGGRSGGDRSLMVTNARHFSLLKKACEELEHASKSLKEEGEPELIAYDIRSAMDFLGEITGEVSNSEILNSIFNSFCIGK